MNRPRVQHIKALALVLALLLFVFGAAQHSAHHLSHLNQPIQCVVCSASAHLAGVAVESVAIEKPALLLEFVPGTRFTDPSIACLSPAHGRAPPSFTA
ncbi:exported protein of unknown function [Candidatus Methylomirabilis oxygeniifera]|uniref:DUF2607 family protein n=1 Tax=Methylomirabilis oxygeniifera TaxID=671143 RepID=D5MGS8_METO1|nr:exported protein of unknown function [Candidatus Methylomirabilis oxyfera]